VAAWVGLLEVPLGQKQPHWDLASLGSPPYQQRWDLRQALWVAHLEPKLVLAVSESCFYGAIMNEYFRQAFLLGLAASAALFVLMFIFFTEGNDRFSVTLVDSNGFWCSDFEFGNILDSYNERTSFENHGYEFYSIGGPWLLPILIVEAFGFGYQVKLF